MKNINVVLSEEQIAKRVSELGKQITDDYKGKKPVVICILKGAILFFSDLIRKIDLPLTIDFARLSSYRGSMESGNLTLVEDIKTNITGRDVIVVEDIADTGKTLSYFVDFLKSKNPASLKVCVFMDKPEKRVVDFKVDYTAFNIDCGFIIGYGLDYNESFRELPYLAEINSPDDLEN